MQKLLLAAALTIAASSASADHNRIKWEGAMRVVSQTAPCGSQFDDTTNQRVRYHPKLGVGYPGSSFTRYGSFETELITLIEEDAGMPRNGGYPQFHGTGAYEKIGIAGGEVVNQPMGTFNFTQTPPQVMTDTVFVTLNGTLHNYAGISGCSLTLRGSLVRVDPEIGSASPRRP